MAGSAEIVLSDLIIEKKENARIADVKLAASYNWLDTYTATILVPGIPPIYRAPRFPPRLSPDAGIQYIDQNGDRNPGSPLESLVAAVHATDEAFDFRSIDIITDRRPIRKLFGFVNGDHGQPQFGPSPSFKFSVEILGEAHFSPGLKMKHERRYQASPVPMERSARSTGNRSSPATQKWSLVERAVPLITKSSSINLEISNVWSVMRWMRTFQMRLPMQWMHKATTRRPKKTSLHG